MNNTIENTKSRKPSNQVIVSKLDDKFLIGKMFTRSIAVISPFEKVEDSFVSNFHAPNNRSKRIQILYNMIPKISRYSVSDSGVDFDCIQSIDESTDIFQNIKDDVEAGYVHFDVTSFKKKTNTDKKVTTFIDINPRLLFTKLPEQDKFEILLKNLNHKFRTVKFKAFSVILDKGFILCTVDKYTTSLYLTINRPDKKFIGNCIRKEINNITANIFPLWPVFNINMNDNKLNVGVEEEVTSYFQHVNSPILIKMEREIESNETIISCIAMSIDIES